MNKEEDIRQAVEVMRRGGVILYPTDTIWGIGCDATNEEAVRRVYDIKKRDDSKALICLVDSDHRLQRYVSDVPNVAWDLIEYATRPLTIIFDKAKNLAPNLLAEDGSVGIRVTREEFSRQLCYRFQKAVGCARRQQGAGRLSPASGEPSPACFDDISDEIKNAVDYIVQSRRKEKTKAVPSSIIKLGSDGEVAIIRK